MLDDIVVFVKTLTLLNGLRDELPRDGALRSVLAGVVGDADVSLLFEPDNLTSVVLSNGQWLDTMRLV